MYWTLKAAHKRNLVWRSTGVSRAADELLKCSQRHGLAWPQAGEVLTCKSFSFASADGSQEYDLAVVLLLRPCHHFSPRG